MEEILKPTQTSKHSDEPRLAVGIMERDGVNVGSW